ncbi:class I SAM-dependent methyltransferase [Luteibacter pinisoli]|uniref:Class I SAM-dependent methyltransferase n=1 Tax=Luteibacter pinisoli TaxID=2589080 RepID=A0A4Y5Z2U6_9GAMM|nr:class I SAM-dependent methyltransferase [Luteibacter pinisoli]QDE38788.1 class I SAM-dependent methyltransferase [Luteibacter pinisoli]
MSGEMTSTWSRGGLVEVPACPMCDSSQRTFITETRDAMTGRTDPWRLWSCDSCRSEWLDPRPDDASLPFAYDFDYVTHRDVSAPVRGGLLLAAIQGYLKRRHGFDGLPASVPAGWLLGCVPPLRLKLDYYARHLGAGRGRTLLDVGCGNGAFLDVARQMGWDAEGVDPDPAAVRVCLNKGLKVTQGFIGDISADRRRAGWDAITLSHSLEHAPRPRVLLHEVAELLVPGGRAWIGIPNPQSRGARLFGAAWESHDAPRHLCLPSADAMESACRGAGFADVRFARRGAHSGRLYRRSAEIESESGVTFHRRMAWTNRLQALVTDLLATVSGRGGDELVVIATLGTGEAS